MPDTTWKQFLRKLTKELKGIQVITWTNETYHREIEAIANGILQEIFRTEIKTIDDAGFQASTIEFCATRAEVASGVILEASVVPADPALARYWDAGDYTARDIIRVDVCAPCPVPSLMGRLTASYLLTQPILDTFYAIYQQKLAFLEGHVRRSAKVVREAVEELGRERVYDLLSAAQFLNNEVLNLASLEPDGVPSEAKRIDLLDAGNLSAMEQMSMPKDGWAYQWLIVPYDGACPFPTWRPWQKYSFGRASTLARNALYSRARANLTPLLTALEAAGSALDRYILSAWYPGRIADLYIVVTYEVSKKRYVVPVLGTEETLNLLAPDAVYYIWDKGLSKVPKVDPCIDDIVQRIRDEAPGAAMTWTFGFFAGDLDGAADH